jgi:hypothetical protein
VNRSDMEEFWGRWLQANKDAEAAKDWRPLADYFAEDATYGWMYNPDEHFMATNREEIRELALGREMAGLDGWYYEYAATVMDESNGMVVGFWKQRAAITDDATGNDYEIMGIGGSWFGLTDKSGSVEIGWQRDWFDLGSTAHTFLAIAGSGKAPQGLLDRMSLNGIEQPGHYRRADLPSTIWPPVVGDTV